MLEASNALLEEPAANDDEVLRGPEVELKVPKPYEYILIFQEPPQSSRLFPMQVAWQLLSEVGRPAPSAKDIISPQKHWSLDSTPKYT
jgi:hypothetical protein